MTAVYEVRDSDSPADVRHRESAAVGWLIRLHAQMEADRCGLDWQVLSHRRRRQLEDTVAGDVLGRLCGDEDEVEQWRDVASRQVRGGVES